MDELPAVLSAEEVGERWKLHRSTVVRMWRQGSIPAPINPQAQRNYRWSRAVIEDFERQGSAA